MQTYRNVFRECISLFVAFWAPPGPGAPGETSAYRSTAHIQTHTLTYIHITCFLFLAIGVRTFYKQNR